MRALTRPDVAAVRAQLGRLPRDLVGVAHRCPCGHPDVVATAPRLGDGSPFPTFYYLTCPRAASAIGTLEADGLMGELAKRLADNPDLRLRYGKAHAAYLDDRRDYGEVPEIADTSAGGMPSRVKCLHALAAHALAAGPGVNPIGDEAVGLLGPWWESGPCVSPVEGDNPGESP
ncbi:MAG: DUF501 domain-containing protein [Nocardioidaceae bacterium]